MKTTKRHLLIVDDDRSLRILFQTLLKMYGYSSDFAESGEEAMTKLTQTYYDAILLDYQLPGVTGIAVLRHIQQRYSSPVVMMTGQSGGSVASEVLEAGAHVCLYKPFDCVDFQAMLTELFGRNNFPRADRVLNDVNT